jgi:DNA-binding IclR family transcriptional regulator
MTTATATKPRPVAPVGPDRQTSLGKALALLDAFPDDRGSIGVTELARRAGVSKPSAFRLLACLEADGYVERAGTSYSVGWRVFELGNRIRPCRPGGLREVARPYLCEVHERTRLTVHLALLDRAHVLYLDKLERREVRTPTRIGGRMPASCTALGKAQLAFVDEAIVEQVVRGGLARRTPYSIAAPAVFSGELERVRADGVAFDREEAAIGLWCVAAPILKGANVVGALSVSGPSSGDIGRVDRLTRQAADALSELVRS